MAAAAESTGAAAAAVTTPATEGIPTTAAGSDEVKPYKIHVSSRYLDLTKQKLEITRLPHEVPTPKSEDWWEPKPQVEPLIDFWLEKYSWRDQENILNGLPQFRTAISIPSSEAPLRIHFLHARSPHADAVPLLLIPPFPFTNLSLGHLLKPLTEPEDAATTQPFHVVIPSLPGLGFSDPFPNNTPAISTTAEMLNTLMARLSYPHYLATNAGPATAAPAEVDWKLINYLSLHHATSCLGAHFISPPLDSPKIYQDPWEWTKWAVANFFHAGILGYSDDDFTALDRTTTSSRYSSPSTTDTTTTPAAATANTTTTSVVSIPRRKAALTPKQFGLNQLGLSEPNSMAYALCDSPTGLLVFVLKGLRLLGPRINFSPEQIITFTELAWLPGPENAMRFWAWCATHEDEAEVVLRRKKDQKKDDQSGGGKAASSSGSSSSSSSSAKPRVAITVFLGGKSAAGATGVAATDDFPQIMMLPVAEKDQYACPAWGNARYSVVSAQRVPGKPGLLAWERPEVIAAGVRGLAAELLKVEAARLRPAAEPTTAPLEAVVVPKGGDDDADAAAAAATATATVQRKLQKQPPGETSAKAAGKSPEVVAPVPAVAAKGGGAAAVGDSGVNMDEESPDTIVVTTPPLGSTP